MLEESIHVQVNRHAIEFTSRKLRIATSAQPDHWLTEDVSIEHEMKLYLIVQPDMTVNDVLKVANIVYQEVTPFQILINGKPEIVRTQIPILLNGKATTPQALIHDGDEIIYEPSPQNNASPVTISDVIYRLGDSLKMHAMGKSRLIMKRNGQIADFTTVLERNDSVEVFWED